MDTVKKWFELLEFPEKLKEDFYKEIDLRSIDTVPELSVEELDQKKDYLLNLIYCLAQCESTFARFEKKGIPQNYFWANIREIVVEAIQTAENFGCVGVDDIRWVDMFLQCKKHFRIGCLNFDMEIAGEHECEGGPVKEEDPVVLVHIPSNTRLDREACAQAFQDAEEFFATYFPEFSYKYFVCGSWLLDDSIRPFLKEGSNIRGFQSFFTLYKKVESRSLLRYVFSRDTTPENITEFEAKNSLQKKLKEYIAAGGKTYEGFGIRERTISY